MKNKILFLVDHKHRDLPSLALISYFLNNMGCKSKLVALGAYDETIKSFYPDFIVLPKPNHDFEKVMSWKLKGIKVVILDSEGNNQDIAFSYKIRIKPDVYLFWNDIEKNKYLYLSNTFNTHLKTLGYYRSDFLYPPMHELYDSKRKILARLSLNHKQPTLTIASSFQETFLSAERFKNKEKKRKSSLKGTDYRILIENDNKLRLLTENLIKILLNKYPNLNIVIKPHPHENVVYWNNFIKSLNNSNLKLLVGESINILFQISDFHIAKNACTTTVESRLYGIKSLELHTDKSIKFIPKKHFLSNYIATNTQQAICVIDSVLFNRNVYKSESLKNNNDVDSYCKKHLYKFDGLRCFEYAKYFVALANGKMVNPNRATIRKTLDDLKNIGLYFIVLIRKRINNSLHRQSKLETQVNNPTAENDRPTSELKGHLVDREYGLFDNRIKKGDEIPWFKKFDKNKHIQNLIK